MLIDQVSKKTNQTVGAAFYAIKAVHAAYDRWGTLPSDGDDDDKVKQIVADLCAVHKCEPAAFKAELIKLVASQADFQLSITCSIFGGMLGDTIVRALTGKEKP
jgi:hypothetical protein